MLTPLQLDSSRSYREQQIIQLPLAQQVKSTRENHQIKEFVPPITISDVQFSEDTCQNGHSAIQRSFRPVSHNATANAANIFSKNLDMSGVKFGNTGEKRDRITYVRYQNYTSTRARKTTEQKSIFNIFQINKFVKKLTENINKEDEVPQISQTKFKALKKIIQYYDIKNLDRSQYTNVIKSFGLQIGSVKAQKKPNSSFSEEKKSQIKKLRALSLFRKTQKKLTVKEGIDITLDQSRLNKIEILSIPAREAMTQQQNKTPTTEGGKHLFNSLQIRKDKFKAKSPKKFKFSSGQNCIIQKVNKYRQFLFVLNYSNRLYRPLDLEQYPIALKFYVGRGNNGNLIRSLMKRRFWFEQTNIEKEAQFVWTQIKIQSIFNRQNSFENTKSQSCLNSKGIYTKFIVSKSDPLGRILVSEEVKSIITLQQLVKTRNIHAFQDRLKYLSKKIKKETIQFETIHNHLPGNGLLGNKKGMFLCLRQYCKLTNIDIFSIVPQTFIISHGLLDPQYNRNVGYFNERKQQKKHNYWIMKPGQFSNRGNGIECTNKIEDIKKRVIKTSKQKKKSSLIIQQYIVKPLLYNGRKFDIRAFMIITWHNGKTKAYWYQDGYVRTSSSFFNLAEMSNPYIHLTNDAVQKNSDQYGQFEDGNKLSYPQLQRYLDSLPALGRNLDLHNVLIPKMKEIARLTVRSAWLGLNKENRDKNFELFGLDFMVDEDFKPWLIEVNTNPCLQMSSPVLQRLIPYMVQNVFRISLDTLFPPPNNFTNNYKYNIPQNSLHYNKFELIFDSQKDGPGISALYQGKQFYKEVQGLQQDKNEYKQDGELLNMEDI